MDDADKLSSKEKQGMTDVHKVWKHATTWRQGPSALFL
jgi:hypothetical protein